jgi:hypothetical protein
MRFKRYKHNLSHYHNTTFNLGQLVPIQCQEILPGDSVKASTSALIRLSPLLAPVMHPVEVRIHHWYVPMRLVWTSWEDFITGGSDGNNTDTVPTTSTTASITGLPRYLGAPTSAAARNINALPIRAYNKIYNTFYRDQDLTSEVAEDTKTVQKIAWAKDPFTAARSSTQKGTEVSLPLGTSADIKIDPFTGGASVQDKWHVATEDGSGNAHLNYGASKGVNTGAYDNSTSANLYADLTNATAATINDLRLAFATQNYMELRQRYGHNYVDFLAYHGITGIDNRLQRPEYLGGGKQTVSFSEVLATAETGTSVDVGDMKGHGIAAVRTNSFTRFFPEHGYLITLCSLRPKSIYANGQPRMWDRTDKEDFYQRELELIGQQEVLNKEIYIDHTTPDGIFGYTDRYYDYRSCPSRVSGEFDPGQALDHWTLSRSFSSDPALNTTFVECDPATRIFASTSTDQLLCMFNNHVVARRMVRKNPQPSIL